MPEPTQPNTPPNPAGAGTPPSDPNAGTPPAGTPPTPPAGSDFDASKLTMDQLNKVLENPELWKNPRMANLMNAEKELRDLRKNQEADEEKRLAEGKKWEELATKRETDLKTANSTLQTLRADQALTNLLVKENVVDLDGALKLVDRGLITINDDGTVTGADKAIASLKENKAYLFSGNNGQPRVGTPSNPSSTPVGANGFKFKESQLTPEFYKANQKEIDEAGRLGLIEPDGPPHA